MPTFGFWMSLSFSCAVEFFWRLCNKTLLWKIDFLERKFFKRCSTLRIYELTDGQKKGVIKIYTKVIHCKNITMNHKYKIFIIGWTVEGYILQSKNWNTVGPWKCNFWLKLIKLWEPKSMVCLWNHYNFTIEFSSFWTFY